MKERAFRCGDREELRSVQHEVRDVLRTCWNICRRKLEARLQQNNVTDVWTARWTAVEDVPLGSSTREVAAMGPQGPRSSGPHTSCDEGSAGPSAGRFLISPT